MQVDYIIVGLGLAGIAFIEELEKNNKSYIVFENDSQNSSKVAGGMFNPVILKRFTPVWNGVEQLQKAIPFYQTLEKKLQLKLIEYIDIKKSFKTIEDQNNWYTAVDHPKLKNYMVATIEENNNSCVLAPHGLGTVTNIGKVLVKKLIEAYTIYIKDKIKKTTFDYSQLKSKNNTIIYKKITAKHIVFCEGYGMVNNPYFKELPLKEAKGELLEIETSHLNINYILKSAVFVMPIKNNIYKVGATFNWTDKTNIPTEKGKEELIKKLDKTINCSYKIINQVAGIRPTVKDRRPLIGTHNNFKNIHILNGLGTRGVMLAPTLSKKLFKAIENNLPIEKEININRFY